MAAPSLTAARLRELLHYNPETGVFVWKVQRQGWGAVVGRVAGVVGANGYVHIGVDRGKYTGHRLAWLYMTGEWPPGCVDHIDGDRGSNAWKNLRSASNQLNAQNIRRPHADSKSGFLGVSFSTRNKTNPWVAQITPPGQKRKNLGYFSTPEEAHAVFIEAKRRLHAGCTI